MRRFTVMAALVAATHALLPVAAFAGGRALPTEGEPVHTSLAVIVGVYGALALLAAAVVFGRRALHLAVLLVVLAMALSPLAAFAQGDVHATTTVVDFAPILNPLIQVVGGILATALLGVAWQVIQWFATKIGIQNMQWLQTAKADVDVEAQKALGGAMARVQIPDGKLTVDVKNQLVADAAQKLIENATPQLRKIASNKDLQTRAAEIIENRVGLMIASAQGTPVPNPSAPAASALPSAPLPSAPAS